MCPKEHKSSKKKRIEIQLPISKSIANRLLILQALCGEDVTRFPLENACDDVVLLREALKELRTPHSSALTLNLQNCGTAMRFLTAFCAVQEGTEVTLTGSERMKNRPIGQLVDALRNVGAHIDYLEKEGFPPLYIRGKALERKPITLAKGDSSQFVSAVLLVGFPVETNDTSPYIEMTRKIMDYYQLERDWSAASYWYEYVALYGGEIFFPELRLDSLQGDRRVAEIFESLGVKTEETAAGIKLSRMFSSPQGGIRGGLCVDFSACPDLYPAVYVTCHELGIELEARGTERLKHKESDRIQAFEQLTTHSSTLTAYSDHRIAMSLLVAGYQVDDISCVSKSYPCFIEQLRNVTFVIPYRNGIFPPRGDKRGAIYINDEGKGKKWALRKGVEQADTEFVWLTDVDVERDSYPIFVPPLLLGDLTILPLRMESSPQGGIRGGLQTVEYLAIQSLTIWAAEKGRAVMCSGANMIVRRERWLESYADLYPEIPSGDDMFLLESFKRRGLTVRALWKPEYIATIQPEKTWSAFFRQRMRWAGKAPKYKDRDILLCGGLTVLMNVLVGICLPFLLVKFPLDWMVLRRAKRYNLTDEVHLGWALLLVVVYPWYVLICLIGGWIRKGKW